MVFIDIDSCLESFFTTSYFFLNANTTLEFTANSIVGFVEDERFLQLNTFGELGGSKPVDNAMAITLHCFCLCNVLSIFDGNLGF